jgi:integrase
MTTLPRYVTNTANTYRYNPPSDAVKAGVVCRKTFGSYDDVVLYSQIANAALDHWRKERHNLSNLQHNARVDALVNSYRQNISYTSLKPKTKTDYDYYIKCWLDSKAAPMAKPLHSTKLEDLTTPTCQRIYEEAAQHSVSLANHSLACYRLLFNYAIRQGFTQYNPFTKVLKRADKARKVVWTREELKNFLDTAYGQFKWRNVGLIVHMAYATAQRLGDLRMLTWDNCNLDDGVLTLEQSKRRARVSIPIPEDLRKLLLQQNEEYGWQQYIMPSDVPDRKGGLKPYTSVRLAVLGSEVMKAAKLPEGLRMADMRRTVISEMLDLGVPLTNIMSMSGHSTPQSLTPYLVHSLKSATLAQGMRNNTPLV